MNSVLTHVKSTGDLIYRLNGEKVYRNIGMGQSFPEPLFAVLNFAKINDSPMTQTWEMELDWVKHEVWQDGR
ncbi:MAG: hypothetical protein AAFZ91_01030 [Pseudomonadota bacterium]